MKKEYGLTEADTFRTMTIQDTGGTKKTVEAASRAIKEMLPIAANARTRDACPPRELTLALQCGGSDGYSGITANPALGAAVDLLVRHGGTAILSETPEIYGAEHLLTRRAASREVGEKLVERIRWWEDYTAQERRRDEQQPLARQQGRRPDDHPREVARRGGQGRHHHLRAVYEYAEPVTAKGFVYMDTPGYDPVAATGQVAGGAQPDLLHHRPRLGLRLQALALDQARHQLRHLSQRWRTTWTSTAATSSTASSIEAKGEEIFETMLRVASGEHIEERGARLRRQRVRALADRRGDVR